MGRIDPPIARLIVSDAVACVRLTLGFPTELEITIPMGYAAFAVSILGAEEILNRKVSA